MIRCLLAIAGLAGGQESPHDSIRVQILESKYSVAPEGAKGTFITGQDADLMLGGFGFNQSGGPLAFNHPTGLATDGTRLLVADRWNNRVLIWMKAPSANTPPDLVLGQKSFSTNNSGAGRDELNWPGNVTLSPDGTKVAVADTNNNRILLWNSFPETSGAPADLVLELPKLRIRTKHRLEWPWGVWTDGKKLAAVATRGAAILVWNSFPARDHQSPDLVLRPSVAGTPRNITSDGTFLIVGDHNNREVGGAGTMFWKSFPTSSDQEPDFVRREWVKGCVAPEGRLILGGLSSIYIWDRFPKGTSDSPATTLCPASYENGDGPDAVLAGGRLYVCNYNGNNILVWNEIPRRGRSPDFVLGNSGRGSCLGNPVPATNGKSLFVSSDFDRKLYVWRNLPNESGAKPDVIYSLPEGPWDNALCGETLLLGGRRTLYLWKRLPLKGELPDYVASERIGSIRLQEITGVALDARYTYVADGKAGRIYVWEGLPASDRDPKWSVECPRAGRLTSDGQYLAAGRVEMPEVLVYRVSDLPGEPVRVGGAGRFNLPGQCLVAHGHLFVLDTCFSRVHVWHRIEDALAGKAADALLGTESRDETDPELGADKLFWPGAAAFDGSYLWIGEFKFSGRVLRFSPKR